MQEDGKRRIDADTYPSIREFMRAASSSSAACVLLPSVAHEAVISIIACGRLNAGDAPEFSVRHVTAYRLQSAILQLVSC